MRLLAADIGGTKTLVALFQADDQGRLTNERVQRYDSPAFADFDLVVERFLETEARGADIAAACVAVAGPVKRTERGAVAQVTNLPWRLDSQRLEQRFGIDVVNLINDFEAVGYGIETLNAEDLVVLQAGRVRRQGPRVVIGAGTGLGVAQLVWAGDHYEIMPSEGGHVDFAPNGAEQVGLLEFLAEHYGHVSVERVLSGNGLVNIYEYLCVQHPAEVVGELRERMGREDPPAAIADYAAQHGESLAAQALNLFVSIYGAHSGNLALTALPYGGLYVAGGIAPKIIDRLRDGRFMEAFSDKGRMSDLTAEIPVFTVIQPQVGLMGAAHAARLAQHRQES